jgi:hypothetical protein
LKAEAMADAVYQDKRMEGNDKMQITNQRSKEKEERKNKQPQLKVRTDIRSGYCVWVDVPPLTNICT